ncbi:MAG: EAL domain-containing protein [Methylobacterium sp.]|uniref:EAL domain-containing protein n=1 Tax=Methylobacterium sp. TaxID=409 RepID=UPI0025EE609C|nr:EAL domain-containing protein [Methylobacterium sp.]MBX9933447.1 EAL domain-containing protein [Methylobacterium sp.]
MITSLHRLRSPSVRITLDDFGIVYSSLSYLRRFPFDKIKIDRSFIREISDPDAAEIVRAIVGIALHLGASVTVKGVETGAQRDQVRQEGCTGVQNDLFSRPLASTRARKFVNGERQGRG